MDLFDSPGSLMIENWKVQNFFSFFLFLGDASSNKGW